MSTLVGQINQINKMNERELELGLVNTPGSWHEEYKASAYIHISGIPYKLTEGDIIQVFSEYGEIVDLNLVRDAETGKSCGFCFLAYEDQRSTDLAVDNLNGIEIVGRKIKVNHTKRYYRKIQKDERRQRVGVGIPKLLMDLYGREFFEKEEKKKKKKKLKKKMSRSEKLEYKREKRRKKEEKRKRRELRKERKERRRREKGLKKKKKILSPEELEKKKIRIQKKKDLDYERRKMLLESGVDGSDSNNQKSASYNMAYKYGSKMNLNEGQFDMTDFKVYQYKKQQEESEKYKSEKMAEDMRRKNEYEDKREEKLKRDLERRRREYENQKRRNIINPLKNDQHNDDDTILRKRRRREYFEEEEDRIERERTSKKRKL